MQAHVWHHRIDILGASSFPNDRWEALLDDLKAEHVPSANPPGKRMTVAISPNGRMDAFIHRTAPMLDEEVIRILEKHGIPASLASESAASA